MWGSLGIGLRGLGWGLGFIMVEGNPKPNFKLANWNILDANGEMPKNPNDPKRHGVGQRNALVAKIRA